MDQTNERAEADDGATDGTVAGKTKKVDRIARQSKELIDDVKAWIDLKIELVELEIQEKFTAIVFIGFFGAMAVVFLLVALALGLGAWLGHPAWGFLMTTGILGSVAGLLYAFRFARRPKKTPEDQPDQKKLAEPSGQKQLPAGSSPSGTLSLVETGSTDPTT